MARTGPLKGLRVLEVANIGPLQHAGMILADLGAIANPPRPAGAGTGQALTEWGLASDEISTLLAGGVIACAPRA